MRGWLGTYTAKNSKHKFPEKELRGHSPNSYIHVSVCDLYIPTIGLPILLQENRWIDPGNMYINCSQTPKCGNWDRGRAVPFLGTHKSKFLCCVDDRKTIFSRLFWVSAYVVFKNYCWPIGVTSRNTI